MNELFVIWLGTLAWLTSVITFVGGVYLDSREDIQHMVDVGGGLTSAFLWFITSFGASAKTTVSSGVVINQPARGPALLFTGFGVIMVVVAFIGTGFLVNVMDIKEQGVR